MNLEPEDINYPAVVVAVVANMLAGALWYSPVLFAKPWMAAVGMTAEDMRHGRAAATRGYIISVVASLVISFALALLVQLAGADGAGDGVLLGLIAGIGFVATTQAASYGFESRPLKLYLINAGYPVAAFVGLGALLGAWQ
jgi:hypothetical protein